MPPIILYPGDFINDFLFHLYEEVSIGRFIETKNKLVVVWDTLMWNDC